MYKKILNKDQIELLPLIEQFKKEFYLVGGTAIALQIGHRRSIDFDLFKSDRLAPKRILDTITAHGHTYIVTRRVEEQLNLIIRGVKITFFEYPYIIKPNNQFENIINTPDLLQLASMKAFALGSRSKWKDYVDLYFILKNYCSIKDIVEISNSIYGQLFSEKLFRAQLSYFKDIDYTEDVEYLKTPPSTEQIKNYLAKIAVKDL